MTSQPAFGSDGLALRYMVGRHRENRISTTIAMRLGKIEESRGRDDLHQQMSWAGFDLRSIRQWREKTFS